MIVDIARRALLSALGLAGALALAGCEPEPWTYSFVVVADPHVAGSAEHDARTILSSPKVGIWLGLEVLAIVIATGSMLLIAPSEDREFRDLLETVGTGAVLIETTFMTIAGLLALLVPFRALMPKLRSLDRAEA